MGFNTTTDKEYNTLTDFINEAEIFELTPEIVQQTISIRKFHKIKIPDAIIAATALVHKVTLITRNTIDFVGIEGLNIVNPFLI